jgi:phage shock protein PspC (stress-responsive transcriptional regulator)
MVVGILRGLGRRFDLDVKIKNLGVDVDFPTGILFELTW